MTRRILSLIVMLAIIIGCLPIVANAETNGNCGDNLTWTLDDNGTLTINGTGNMWGYESVDAVPWVNYNEDNIKTVIINDGVTSIGNYAFFRCNNLTSITIPDSVTNIGDCTFEWCYSLTSVTMPHGLISIGNYAFASCNNLTSITIPNNVANISEGAFDDCDSLTNITIPYSVMNIDNGAFRNCNSLININVDAANTHYCSVDGVLFNKEKTVLIQYAIGKTDKTYTIPNGVANIDKSAFSGCDNITSVTIPNSVTSICDYVFSSCNNLTSVNIPSSVANIGEGAFLGCDSLTSVTIPNSVTSIGDYTFAGCRRLISATISNRITSIGDGMFSACENLTSITIPSSVTGIGNSAFEGCYSLISITIPNETTIVGNSTFSGCSGLTNIAIGDNVTSIGEDAFRECESLVSIVIPDSVVNIGEGAFWNCKNLTSVKIGKGIKNIGNAAFWDCSNLNVYYNGSIEDFIRIDKANCLFQVHCKNGIYNGWGMCGVNSDNAIWMLEDNGTLTIKGIGEIVSEPWFGNSSNIKTVVIENGVTNISMLAFTGCENLMSVKIGNSVTSIGYRAFDDCESLSSITIPDSVTSIDMEAFEDCTSLTSVIIGNGVTSIGDSAFNGCSSLTNITIPDSVKSIDSTAFWNCRNLTSITIGRGVKSIGQQAFDGCNNLKNVYISDLAAWCNIYFEHSSANPLTRDNNLYVNNVLATDIVIPNGVTSIGYAFSYYANLTSITIPNSVISIGEDAFYDCTGLKSVSIPNSVTSIGRNAFWGCSGLTSVTIPNNVTSIGRNAFYNCSLNDIYYNGTEEQWREISSNAGISSSPKLHYNSGQPYTPVNVNPSKPNSGDSGYAYGISSGSGKGHNQTMDVRERLKNSADSFNKAALEYTEAVSKSAKKQAGTTDDIESLANKLEKENRILFTTSLDSKTKKAAYVGYAKYLNQMVEEGISLNKINLSDNSIMIDYKLTSQILSKLRGKKLSYEYKGYTIKINSLAISKSYFGTLDIFTPQGGKISAMISSDTNKTMADLQDFANQLKDVAQDVNKKALRAVVSDLVNLTGLGNLGTLIARDGLKSYKPLTKLGYGDVVKNVKKCYSGYEAVKGILNCTQISSLDSIIDNPKQLVKKINNLCEQESDIENAVVNAAQDKLIDSLYNLLYASQAYEEMRNGKQPTLQERVKDFFDKTTSWVSSIFQCPVDFTVYDENGEMIGYVDDGAVYYNDDIYIKVSGDVKTLYVPVGMKVDIKMTGTDEGEFNYIVEEVIYNQPTGRLNYYRLPLSEGTEYTQNLDTTEFDNSTDVLPITSQNGDVLPNEYISSEDTTAYVIINTDTDNEGTVLGGGEYAKGDSVELSAVPMNSNYEFNGWYVEDELISVDNIYRFTAIENTDIHAEFMRVYNEDNAYEMQIPNTSNDIYPYIYKDYDGSKGVVIVPFTEELADNMQIYVTTYATDGSILNSDILCSATFNENGIYAFENVDLENVAKVVIKDENSIEIASADYDSDKDIDNIVIEVSDKYSDSLNVTAREELGNIIVNFNILDDKINQNDIVAYLAEYDENGILLNCTILDEITTENGIEFDAYLGDNYKLMFWDNNMCPITEAITTDWIEV